MGTSSLSLEFFLPVAGSRKIYHSWAVFPQAENNSRELGLGRQPRGPLVAHLRDLSPKNLLGSHPQRLGEAWAGATDLHSQPTSGFGSHLGQATPVA